MNIELKQFGDLDYAQQWRVATAVSAETKSQFGAEQKIVPIEPVTIFQKDLGVIALQNGALVGYIGATQSIEHDGHDFSQISSLVVPINRRGIGIGSLLVGEITGVVTEREHIPFAFANQNSLVCLENSGYLPALPDELPVGASSKFGNQALVYPAYQQFVSNKLVGASVLG